MGSRTAQVVRHVVLMFGFWQCGAALLLHAVTGVGGVLQLGVGAIPAMFVLSRTLKGLIVAAGGYESSTMGILPCGRHVEFAQDVVLSTHASSHFK